MPMERRQESNTVYEFTIRGDLSGQWCDWFGDLQMVYENDETVLWGPVPDQAALYGIIARLRNLGLTLLSVNQRPAGAAQAPDYSETKRMKEHHMNRQTQPQTASPTTGGTYPVKDRLSFVWLILAFVVSLFSNGMTIVPIAAWLAPVFMLRFLRTRRALPGLLIGYVASALAFYIYWRPAFLDAGTMFTVYSGAFALLFFLPFVIDRLLAGRVPGFLRTLILPVAWVSVEYTLHLVSPLGTFFLTPFTQGGNLPLLQILTITGMWSITFLIGWFASVVNYAWEARFDMQRVGRGVAVYAVILAAVLLFGGIRLALNPPTGETVKVAVLTTNVNKEYWPDGEDTPLDKGLIAGTLSAEELERVSGTMAEINNDLLTQNPRAGPRRR